MLSLPQWIAQLKQCYDIPTTIELFVKKSPVPTLYFAYNVHNAQLTLKCHNLSHTKSQTLYLYEMEPEFHPSQLYHPKNIPSVHKIFTQLLDNATYECTPLVFNKQVTGIVAYQTSSLKQHINTIKQLKNQLFILDYYIKNFLWMDCWQKDHTIDMGTNCLNKKSLLKILFMEVSRARRLLLPVSVIALQVDCISALESAYGSYQTTLLLKSLANNIKMEMRAYDSLGVLEGGKLALILPHTGESSAGMRAEKIRWVVKSSDFSKVFPTHPQISISLGLVEYPKVGRSAEDLLHYVLKACAFAHTECGGNMTAVADPSTGFKQDFQVPDRRHDLIRNL